MKKVCLFLLSAMLTVMLAFGLVACGNNDSKKPDDNNPGGVVTPPDDKDPDNPDDKDPEKPTKPVIKLDKDSITLIIGEDVVVTATVTGSDKAPSFSLGGTTVAAIQTETNAKSATIKGLAGGDDTLTVQLEGADAVTVPVKVENVDYRFNADFDEAEKIFDAGVTGEDDGETATISVTHFIENAKIEYSVEGAAATVTASEDGKTATVKAEQAGVAKVTAKILTVKENAEEGGEQPQDGETEPTVEYEEHAVKTYTVVCTDDWNDLAEESLIGTELLEYREVKNGATVVGYEAFISGNASASDIMDEGDVKGVLRIPAIHNRLPVVSIGKNPQDIATLYFLAYEKPLTDDQIAAIEDATQKANAQAYKEKVAANKDAVDAMQSVYAAVKTVYLPCTITSIPDLTFRLATVTKIEVQKGNHIKEFGIQSFNQMSELEAFNIQDCAELTTIKNNAFDITFVKSEIELTIPKSVVRIEKQAFSNTKITALHFEAGNHITDISGSFAWMQNLASFDFSELPELTVIGASAFEAAGNGQIEFFIPNTIKEVAAKAFAFTRAKKIEFEISEKDENDNYAPGINLVSGVANSGSSVFFGANVQTIILRNISNFSVGGDYVMQSAACDLLVFGEDIQKTQLDVQWIFAFTFLKTAKAGLMFEGADSDLVKNIDSVTCCGALMGHPAFVDPTPAANLWVKPKTVYIHKAFVEIEDSETSKINAYFTTNYNKNNDFVGEGELADYTEWTLKA